MLGSRFVWINWTNVELFSQSVQLAQQRLREIFGKWIEINFVQVISIFLTSIENESDTVYNYTRVPFYFSRYLHYVLKWTDPLHQKPFCDRFVWKPEHSCEIFSNEFAWILELNAFGMQGCEGLIEAADADLLDTKPTIVDCSYECLIGNDENRIDGVAEDNISSVEPRKIFRKKSKSTKVMNETHKSVKSQHRWNECSRSFSKNSNLIWNKNFKYLFSKKKLTDKAK